MKTPQFSAEGDDTQTFAPFRLINCLDTEWKDVRLEFSDWDWIQSTYGDHEVDEYYLNGYGVEGIVKAALFAQGLDPEMPDLEYNSESSTCYIHFTDLDLAIRVAELSAETITNPEKLKAAIEIAKEHDFDDG